MTLEIVVQDYARIFHRILLPKHHSLVIYYHAQILKFQNDIFW